MENNLHNIDQIFAKSLGDHSMDPSGAVWDKIQNQLDASGSSHNVDKVFEKGLGQHTMEPPAYVWQNITGTLDLAVGRRRRIIGWIVGTGAAVVIAFVGGYFIANSGDSASDGNISEKISNTHQVQIDVNHFWDLRNVVIGQTTSGGHDYTTNTANIPNDNSMSNNANNSNVNPNTNTTNSFGNKTSNDSHPGYFGTGNKLEKRNTPNIINNDERNPSSPAENQDKGGNENGKKDKAVTTDVNGPVESQIGNKGFSSVTANNNAEVIVQNSTNNVIVSENNSTVHVDEDPMKLVNPRETSTTENTDPVTLMDEATTFTILPYFSPTLTWRNSSMLSTNGIQDAFDTLNGNSKFNEQMNFSYSTGLLVGYNFTKNLTVFIGASFNSFSNTTNRNNIHTKAFDQMAPGDSSTHMLTSAGELDGVNVVPTSTGSAEDPTYLMQDNIIGKVSSITQTFSYVEVPVMVRYRIGGPKFGLILTGGVSTGFMVQNDVTLVGANETRNFGQTSQIRNFNMNASFGVGIEAKLTRFMFLNIEPTFKYSFLNWSMDSRFQINPISLGLNTGLAFKF